MCYLVKKDGRPRFEELQRHLKNAKKSSKVGLNWKKMFLRLPYIESDQFL